ncbi:MAG: hypothetical protein JSV65_16590 [Armatimonadota bacterium]|nr:MAG: hypothetical protein JSV65_16590 [Armatimonadota bacterium]
MPLSSIASKAIILAAGIVILAAMAFQRPRDATESPEWQIAAAGPVTAAAISSAQGGNGAHAEPQTEPTAGRHAVTRDARDEPQRLNRPFAEDAKAIEARAQAHMDKAYELADRGDMEGALRELRAIPEECPSSEQGAMAHYQIGVALQASGKYDEAVTEFERLAHLSRTTPLADSPAFLRLPWDLQTGNLLSTFIEVASTAAERPSYPPDPTSPMPWIP